MEKQKHTAGAYVKLPGSTKMAPKAAKLDSLNPHDTASVTIRVRRKASIDAAVEEGKIISREQYAEQFGASDEDIATVEKFAAAHHLSIADSDKGRRSVMVTGRITDLETAFQVHLTNYQDTNGKVFRGRFGDINVPTELNGIVEGVFGLDNRANATPKFKFKMDAAQEAANMAQEAQEADEQKMEDSPNIVAHAANSSFNPNQIATIYGFPTNVTGKNQCIAIIELGGGYRNADLATYFAGLGIPLPSVKAVSIDGATNKPTTANGADGEVMLDIEVAGAVAPGASIVVYFAPNTDKGFLDAITTAVHDNKNKPSVISISWGAPEKSWTSQALASFNEAFKAASLLGVTITVAAGDGGSADGLSDGMAHADFPASSPYVLACGGTKLVVNGTQITSETVWHAAADSATGGGVSEVFPLPAYQNNANVPLSVNNKFKGRGLPDVAGDADPASGYNVRVDGQNMVIGGTSAVAPLMAGFIALINEKNQKSGGTPAGFINPKIYADQSGCRDITSGNNITTTTNKGYTAGKGWDACTGWGVLSKL